MNRPGLLAYGAAIAGVALFTGREVIDAGVFVYEGPTPGMASLALVGWLMATLGPLALSVWVWRLARRLRPQWALHLVFLPCAIAIARTGSSLLFYAAGVPDGDSIQGYTLIAAFLFLLLTLFVHAAALAALAVAAIGRRAKLR